MMQGTDIEAIKEIRKITKKTLIAAGGISTIDEIKTLIKMNVSTQLGMSIYTGAIKLENMEPLPKEPKVAPAVKSETTAEVNKL